MYILDRNVLETNNPSLVTWLGGPSKSSGGNGVEEKFCTGRVKTIEYTERENQCFACAAVSHNLLFIGSHIVSDVQ